MAHSHYTGTGTGTENHCFLLYPSRSLSLTRSRSRAVCISHNAYVSLDVNILKVDSHHIEIGNRRFLFNEKKKVLCTCTWEK